MSSVIIATTDSLFELLGTFLQHLVKMLKNLLTHTRALASNYINVRFFTVQPFAGERYRIVEPTRKTFRLDAPRHILGLIIWVRFGVR